MIHPRLDRLRLRHLRLIEMIDRQRSLRAVAETLNLTQPAVSQMVKDLEDVFAARLVDRSARGVTLTAAGQQALQRARAGLAIFDHLAEELHAEAPPTLRVATNPAMMFRTIPDALRRLGVDRGGTRFTIATGLVGDMLHALAMGEHDCYVGRVDWDRLPAETVTLMRHEPLVETELVLACPATHPLAARGTCSVRDLAGALWILPPLSSNNRVALETALRHRGLPSPAAAIEIATADLGALITTAKQMNCLTVVARLAVEGHTGPGELVVLSVPDLPLPPIRIGFVTLADHEAMDALRAFRDALVAVVAG